MLQGLRSHISTVPDLDAAKAWYTGILGYPPYFDDPFYVGFNVGGYELGLLPGDDPDHPYQGSITFWGVPDADTAYAHLLEQGATEHASVVEVGGGIRLGSVRDPSGNILGVIYNPHFQVQVSDDSNSA
jgi:catechol 2,3-dioxygenase-like lactoylglutathione lyase family enzyme